MKTKTSQGAGRSFSGKRSLERSVLSFFGMGFHKGHVGVSVLGILKITSGSGGRSLLGLLY